jgi:hypothetical protein
VTGDAAPAVPGKVASRPWSWYPLLVGPAATLATYAAYDPEQPFGPIKRVLETGALGLTGSALVLCLVHRAVGREPYHLVLAAVAGTVLLREIHWDWTDVFVYVALAAIAAWGWAWRPRIAPYLDRSVPARVWLVAAAVTYVLSQLVARRVFRDILPDEQLVYDRLEEVLECTAHLALLVATVVGPWSRRGPA